MDIPSSAVFRSNRASRSPRSAGIGKGSEFAIRLPLLGTAKPVLHEDTASVAQKRGVTRRVLVVDDNLDSVESLSILLKMEGHDVRTARDGGTALQVAADFEPDIVLLDIGLPGMNGYEVARELRAQRQCAHGVLIALTGYGQPEDECQAKAAGFDYHLVKPVDPNALTELVGEQPRQSHRDLC